MGKDQIWEMFSFPFFIVRLARSSLRARRFTRGSRPRSAGEMMISSWDFSWLVRLSFWLERLYLSLERRSGKMRSYIQARSFSFCRKSSSSLSLSTVLNSSMPVIQLRSMRLLLLLRMATSRLTDLMQSRNHSFISLSQTSIRFGLLPLQDYRLVELARDPSLPSRFSNTLLRLLSYLRVSILRAKRVASSSFLCSSTSNSSHLFSSIDLFMPSILKDLICSLSCSSLSRCSFSISLILFLRYSFSWVMESSLEQSLSASSRKMTISFSRYWMRSLEENIFSCSSDLCLISASSFFILEMWLRQAYRNQASCFLITCSTFLSMSSMALLRSRQAQKTGCVLSVVINWDFAYILIKLFYPLQIEARWRGLQ